MGFAYPMSHNFGKVGIIAGSGELPAQLVHVCQASGWPFFVLALEGQADLSLQGIPHAWNRLGAIEKSLNILKNERVNTLVMAGGVVRPSLFALRPDLLATKILGKLGRQAFGDDGLLRGVFDFLESEGFQLVGAHELLESLICSEGVLGDILPSEEEEEDLRRAQTVAKALGQVDVGQGCVVQQGLVLALEAVEGTDHMLERVPEIRSRIEGMPSGGVLVKVSKPFQEMRVDLPTIGAKTILKAWEVGLKGVGLEAGRSLLLGKDHLISLANEKGLFILGLGKKE